MALQRREFRMPRPKVVRLEEWRSQIQRNAPQFWRGLSDLGRVFRAVSDLLGVPRLHVNLPTEPGTFSDRDLRRNDVTVERARC